MQKNDLMRQDDTILRVLAVREDTVLVINCSKLTMPKWLSKTELTAFESCTEEELSATTGVVVCALDKLSAENRRIVHERYTLIAGILPFICDEKQKSAVIAKLSAENHVNKQTIRHYLCLYMAYQDLSVLAPKQKIKNKELTADEKNMRWALNKYYYTKNKNSLHTAYTMMLKEKYCDKSGNLLAEYPSIHQFRYFYKKHKKLQTYYIARNGMKSYQRNNRPLLGDGIREFAVDIGTAMLDSTICDIYLINDAGDLVGRPILTACVDAYSGLCCGYHLSWEGGVYSLRNLLVNVITDKVAWCKKFGIPIRREDWNCNQLPAVLVTDMGKEYKSQNFEQLTELGVKIINLPAYRPELKGAVEKFFDVIQNLYKKHLKGKGIIEPDFQERGSYDYRKDACLTMAEFERIILHCIIYYNSQRIIDGFPYTEEMIAAQIQPYASKIWNHRINQTGANLIDVDAATLMLTLLPRTTGRFSRNGLHVNKLRYKHEAYTESYLKGGVAIVAFDPDDVSKVWLLENGRYIPFELIESRFNGKELETVSAMKANQREIIKLAVESNLQAQINLAEHIEAIAGVCASHEKVNMKTVRNTRSRERIKSRMEEKGGVGDV